MTILEKIKHPGLKGLLAGGVLIAMVGFSLLKHHNDKAKERKRIEDKLAPGSVYVRLPGLSKDKKRFHPTRNEDVDENGTYETVITLNKINYLLEQEKDPKGKVLSTRLRRYEIVRNHGKKEIKYLD